MASAHHAVSGELSMRDERRPGLDGPGRMVKSRGLDGKISYLTKIWGFAKGLSLLSPPFFEIREFLSSLVIICPFPGCLKNTSIMAHPIRKFFLMTTLLSSPAVSFRFVLRGDELKEGDGDQCFSISEPSGSPFTFHYGFPGYERVLCCVGSLTRVASRSIL